MGLDLLTLDEAARYSRKLQTKPRIHFFGHSYVEGLTGPSKKSNRFSTQMCGLLNAREENRGVHGDVSVLTGMLTRTWRDFLPAQALPFAPATHGAMIYVGINDLTTAVVQNDPTLLIAALRACIHYLRAQAAPDWNDTSFTFAQGTGGSNWTGQGSSSYPIRAGGFKRANANGNTWTINTATYFPNGVPGGKLRVWGTSQLNTGSVHTVTVDGSAFGTFDTRGGTQSSQKPWVIEITGLSSGTHTIVGTIGSIATSDNVVYWEVAASTPPPVVVANINRCISYAAIGGGIADADVTAMNTRIAALVAEFTDGRVLLLDADTLINKAAGYFAADSLHLNDAGHALIAANAANAMRGLLLDGSNYAGNKSSSPDSPMSLRVPQTGVNPAAGIATLVSGTVTVSTRALESASDVILLTRQTGAGGGTPCVTARTNVSGATTGSFAITSRKDDGSTDTADTGTIGWMIVHANA